MADVQETLNECAALLASATKKLYDLGFTTGHPSLMERAIDTAVALEIAYTDFLSRFESELSQ